MSKTKSSHSSDFRQMFKKLLLSSLAVSSFIAYSVYERSQPVPTLDTLLPTDRQAQVPTAAPQSQSALNTTAKSAQSELLFDSSPKNLYKDGTFIGPVTNAFYGNVQVEAVVQGGQLTDVRFLDYPHDRRTSQWINSQATPYLKQEAIRAQSAHVNIISGATLTSQAFIESLQTALSESRS